MAFQANKPPVRLLMRNLGCWLVTFLVLLIGLSITTVLWWNAKQGTKNHLRAEFELSADFIASTICNRFDDYKIVMRGLKGYFSGSEHVSSAEFRRYVTALDLDKIPGIQGIGLVTIVPHAEKNMHSALIRSEGISSYRIKPEGRRERYAPIIYMEPMAGDNLKVLGFDILTIPAARVAMEKARDRDDIVITSKLHLIQDDDKPGVFGFVLYLPFFRHNAKLESIADRRAAIVGWADVPFRMNDLMAGLANVIDPDIGLEIHDGESASDQTLLYRSGNWSDAVTGYDPLRTLRQLDIGGRRWTLLLNTTPEFEARISDTKRPWIVACAGITLTLTLSWLAWLLAKGRDTATLRYRKLFEQAGDGVLVFRGDQRFLDANPSALQMLGYRLDELMQRKVPDILAAHEHSRFAAEWDGINAIVPKIQEWRHIRKDGSEFPGEINVRQLDDKLYLAIVRDLTERKKAEQRIQRLSRLYKALSETNQAIVRMIDEADLFPLICRCAVDLGGMNMAWLGQLDETGEFVMPIVSYGSGTECLEGSKIAADAGNPESQGLTEKVIAENRPVIINDYFALPMSRLRHDRAVRFGWRAAAAFPIPRGGKPFAAFTVFHADVGAFDEEATQLLQEMASDVSFALDNFDRETRRRKAEAALAESEAKLATILENVGAYIFLKDPQGRYLFANKKVLDLWGKTLEEVVGFGDETFFDAQSAAQIRENDRIVLVHGKTIEREETDLATESGKTATYWTVKMPLRRKDGSIYALCGISTDISERKRLEQQLQESREKLELFIQYAPASLAMFDRDMRYIAVSRRWIDDYRLEGRSILGVSHYTVFPEIPERWKAVHRRGLAGEISRCDEDLFVRVDGTKQWLCWEVRPWIAGDQSIGGIVIFTEDITARKTMELALVEKEQLLSESQRIAHIGSWRFDIARGNILWSDETYRISQIDPEKFDHTLDGFARLLVPEDRPLMTAWIDSCLAGKSPKPFQCAITVPDSNVRIVEIQGVLQCDASGAPVALAGTVQDVTRRSNAEQQLRLTAKVFESSQEGIIITDANNSIISANPAYAEISGYTLQEAIGKNPRLVASGQHGKTFYQAMWNEILTKGHWQGEVINRRKSGELYPQWLSISVIRDPNGQITHHIGILSDLTEHKSAQERIQFLSNFDSLTQLPNIALLRDRTKLTLASARRENEPVVLMHLDIDRFNIINDSLGPKVGDRLLQEFARRLTNHLHSDDTLSRQGSDEFSLLLPNTDAEGAAHVAQKLLKLIAEPFTVAERRLNLSASIGIAIFPQDGGDFEQLLQSADAALFRAKQKGRASFQFFTRHLHERATEVLLIENELRQGLVRNELLLHYQPQVNAKTLEIVGAEALIRWRHPQKGLMSPGLFIPIAEESELITEIGSWVLHEAARQITAWQSAGFPVVPVAVNLSVQQFRQDSFYESIVQILRQYKIDPALLELELTEGIAMENSERTITIMEKLHNLGLKLSIDDFGTGYSSLSYLKRFSIDKLKIDQSFVRDLGSDPEDAAIVIAIINMAKSLGFKTIAEGVETHEQLEFLRKNESDEIQGYFVSKPLPVEEFEVLLRNERR